MKRLVTPDRNASCIHFTLSKRGDNLKSDDIVWSVIHPFVDGSECRIVLNPSNLSSPAPISVQINARGVTESFRLVWHEMSAPSKRLEQQEKSQAATGLRELVNLDFFPTIFYMLINQSMKATVILIFQVCNWIEFVTLEVKVLHSLPFWL